MTARHKLLLCCFLLAICPPFLYCKLFCRQDGGIATPSNLFKTALSLASHNALASLVKGEVLSSTKIRATTGGIATPPPLSETALSLRLALNLPPLSKGGGLTALHKLLLCCFLLAICPLILYCKLFCRQDGGIATPSNLFKTALSLASHNALASLVKGEVLSSTKIRATTGGIATPPPLSETALSHPLFVMLTSVYAFWFCI